MQSPYQCNDTYACFLLLFFFNHPAPAEIYTLSLHDALPIWLGPAPSSRLIAQSARSSWPNPGSNRPPAGSRTTPDRKSTRLNSSHQIISYAVFCLKKKKIQNEMKIRRLHRASTQHTRREPRD